MAADGEQALAGLAIRSMYRDVYSIGMPELNCRRKQCIIVFPTIVSLYGGFSVLRNSIAFEIFFLLYIILLK